MVTGGGPDGYQTALRVIRWWRGLPSSERPVMVSLGLLYLALAVAGVLAAVTYA